MSAQTHVSLAGVLLPCRSQDECRALVEADKVIKTGHVEDCRAALRAILMLRQMWWHPGARSVYKRLDEAIAEAITEAGGCP